MEIVGGLDLSEQPRKALVNELELRLRLLDHSRGLPLHLREGADEIILVTPSDQPLERGGRHHEDVCETARRGEPKESACLEGDPLMRAHARPARPSQSKSSRAS